MWPELIMAGSSLLSGLLGNRSSSRANQLNAIMAQRNIDLQRDFAKHGISWRVEDARKAGLHPLAALGAQTSSFYPVQVGQSGKDFSFLDRMGQSLARIADKKTVMLNVREQEEKVKNMELQNAILRKEIRAPAGVNTVASTFGITNGSGGSVSPGSVVVPKQVTSSQAVGLESGLTALESFSPDSEGYLWQKPSQEIQETLESSWFDQAKYIWYRGKKWGKAAFYYRNPEGAGAAAHRDWIRSIRPKAPAGYEFQFAPNRGFILKKKIGKGKLYEKDINYRWLRFGDWLRRKPLKRRENLNFAN